MSILVVEGECSHREELSDAVCCFVSEAGTFGRSGPKAVRGVGAAAAHTTAA